MMSLSQIEAQCDLGQRLLMQMEYIEAERVLAEAELQAWSVRAWDILARLYLPLQEARRQRRQRCGEGIVCLDLVARSPSDVIDAQVIARETPQGQLLIGGWGTIAPAVDVRNAAARDKLYLETFLAAAFSVESKQFIVIVPRAGSPVPPPSAPTLVQLRADLPEHCLILSPSELPTGKMTGSAETYAFTMALWERLHAPFLQRAEAESDPMLKMQYFREAIEVDYGCELAHQHLADVARQLRRHAESAT